MREAYTSTTLERPGLRQLIGQLRSHQIKHLIVDKVDRMSREGVLAGFTLLHELDQTDVRVHLSDGTVLDAKDEYSMLIYSFQLANAQQTNALRIDRIKSSNRAYARRGRYHRGNRPPYGWQYEPTQYDAKGNAVEYKLVHDPATFPVRERILMLYQQGQSFMAIARLLTQEGVPTSSQLAGQKHVADHWAGPVIRRIVESPLNVGMATSIRQRKDGKTWKALPLDEQVTLPEGTVEPFISEEQAMAIARRVQQNKRRRTSATWQHRGVLSGGLARCATCGNWLSIHAHDAKYIYYVCPRQEYCKQRLRVPVAELDSLVWKQVCATLLEPGALEALAARQAELDAGDDPASQLKTLLQVKTSLEGKARKLIASIADAQTEYARQVLTGELDKLAGAVQEADVHIAEYELAARDQELRRRVLNNVQLQVERHRGALEVLELEDATDRPIIRTILDSLGCLASVQRQEDRSLTVAVDLNLSRALTPWFQPLGADDIELAEGETDLIVSTFNVGTSEPSAN